MLKPTDELVLPAVASLVANYLNKTLSDGMIVAVGMGRNVGAVAENVFLIAAVRLIVQHTEPCQCGTLLLGSNGNS